MSIRTVATKLLATLGLLSFIGCSRQTGQQKVSLPARADLEQLSSQRAVVERYLADDASRAKYTTPAGKLGTLRALLKNKVFQPTQTQELQCMGVVLGDAFVQKLEMEWVMVEDEHGTDAALRLPGTSVIIFPLTMISKRIERGEDVDVFELFEGVANQIEQVKKVAD